MSAPVRSAVVDLNTLPKSSSTRSGALTTEPPPDSSVPRSASRPAQGSAAARFTVRSAHSLANLGVSSSLKRLREMFDREEPCRAEMDGVKQKTVVEPAKEVTTRHQQSTARESCVDMEAKERGRAPSRVKFIPDTKVATDSGTQSCTTSDVKPRGSPDSDDPAKASSQSGSARGRTGWRNVTTQSRSKSLDWRSGGQDRSRAGLENLSGSTVRDSPRRAESLERKQVRGANFDRSASYKDCGGGRSVLSRIQAFNAVSGNEKPTPPLGEGETATPSSKLVRTLDRAGGDWSLPLRLKPQNTQRSPVERGCPWRQPSQEDLGVGGDKQKPGSWLRDFGVSGSKPNEVTGNQTILDRIERLYGMTGPDNENPKRHSAPVGDWLDSLSSGIDLSPSQKKVNADVGCPFYIPHGQLQQKGGTFPTTRRSLDNRPSFSQDVISRLDIPPSLNTSVTPVSSQLQERSVERKAHGNSEDLNTKSLDRARSRLSATAQLKHLRETEKPSKEVSKEEASSSPKATVIVQEGNLKEEGLRMTMETDVTSGKAQDSVTENRGEESRCKAEKSDVIDKLSRTKDSEEANKIFKSKTVKILTKEHSLDRDFPTPSKAPVSPMKGSKSTTEDEDVFDTSDNSVKGLFRRQANIKGKFNTPPLDSVRTTIHKFEALAQQSQTPLHFLKSRRAFSVQEHPKDRGGLKKSESDHILGGRMQGGLPGGLRGSSKDKAWAIRSVSVDEAGLRLDNSEMSEIGLRTETKEISSDVTDNKSLVDLNKEEVYKKSKDIVEPDLPATSFHTTKNTVTIKGHVKSNSKSEHTLSQNCNNNSNGPSAVLNDRAALGTLDVTKVSDVSEDDAEKTPTNSPDRLPLFPSFNGHLPSPSTAQASSENIHLLPGPDSEPPSPTNSFQSTQDTLFNHGPFGPTDCPPLDRLTLLDRAGDTGPFSVSMARWSSDEEDDEDDDGTQKDENSDYDSDSGESSVTITSNMSRRSFSVSLAELCNFGGVDYSLPDDSEDDSDDWPSGRTASLSSDISVLSCVTLLGTEELDTLLQDVRNLGDDNLQNYDDVQVVVLHKEVGIGLGFTMAGGVDQNKPVTVHKVFPHGVAGQEGSIQEGDVVLSINGTTLQNSAHWEALRTLRKARGRDMAVVVLQRGGISDSHRTRNRPGKGPPSTDKGETGQQLRVTLRKRSSDLGFSLEGGLGSSLGDKPITVQKLFQGGPVGDVCPGDELLEINGQSMTGLRRLEAWQLIKKLPVGAVEVLLRRPH